ncbi:MAG: hydantoinase/oxoprolinase family protein [Ectothiorhodospiraceae bacterium]|nr:hydantoinase/oxoprolinase family protein [Ectothiorhodospiraceae bacterium]
MGWRIGVDIGGTFIDFCALDTETLALHTLKVLTTPEDPGRELLDGLASLAERHGVDPRRVERFVHGTTVGINTVIQRKGARLAMITNAGFEDVIELGRLRMPEMYSLFCARPDPLIPRDRIFGLAGRMLADGREEAPVDLAALPGLVETLAGLAVEGVIVAFLHAHVAPDHENAVKAALAALAPGLFVFTSAEVWPVVREYERTTTAILNGYVHPRVAGYLGALETGLAGLGVPTRPLLTRSNGGLMSAAEGKRACVSMLLSGTASGVIGASWLARQAGVANVLTLDVGGTSADLALIVDGAVLFGTDETIGEFPLHIPSVSVSSIGVGGGSIGWIDGQGILRLGPESAGSSPGPACYGRGGTQPTLTDAMAICGYLGHAPMAYGQLDMDAAKARASLAPLATALGRGLEETAQAMVDIAVSELFVEVEKLVSRHGVDLRDFALMPFGGGGPMLGCLLARELDIGQVIAPRRPGVVSALGGLVAELKADFIRSLFVPCADVATTTVREALADLAAQGERWLREGQGFRGSAVSRVSADMRYAGQSFEIEVPLEASDLAAGNWPAIRSAFHARHLAVYDFDDPTGEVELVNLRLVAVGETPPLVIAAAAPSPGPAVPARTISVRIDGAPCEVPLYLRGGIEAGQTLRGPAVVAQEDTTLVIPPGFSGHVDGHLNIALGREVEADRV